MSLCRITKRPQSLADGECAEGEFSSQGRLQEFFLFPKEQSFLGQLLAKVCLLC